MAPTAFITGGAGFIGSVTAATFVEEGWQVVVFDDLSRGHRQAVPAAARLVQGDIRDRQALVAALGQYSPDCVLHFAALAYVGESFERPGDYFDINIGGTAALLAAMAKVGCGRLVFSSSCTVYGEPDALPIDERAALKPPVSPYGHTKAVGEQMVRWMAETGSLAAVCLRYFNAAGAWQHLGEDHAPETHLIPLVVDAALGRRPAIAIFGNDYPTRDGSCIRDYIHVRDLATAHVAAARELLAGQLASTSFINLGVGHGHSVLEVIRAVEQALGRPVPTTQAPRRPGDAPELVAATTTANKLLSWRPRHSDLATIVADTVRWRQDHPQGYPAP